MNNTGLTVQQKPNWVTGVTLYSENVTHVAKVIFRALTNGVTVNSINDYRLNDVLNAAITKVHLDLQRALPGETELVYMRSEIIKRIRIKKWNIRDTEILIAFENGINNEYGEYYGLNAISFNKFIAAYCSTENTDRMEALKTLNAPREEKQQPPSPVKQFSISLKNALNGYKNFLADTKTVKDENGERIIFGSAGRFGSVIFDFFYKILLFEITQEEIDDIMKRGLELHHHELLVKRSQQTSALKRKDTEKAIEKIVNLMQVETENKPESGEVNPLVVSAAKRIYINELFQGFYAEEINIMGLARMIYQLKK